MVVGRWRLLRVRHEHSLTRSRGLRAAIATPASAAEPWRVPRARRPTSVGAACFARRARASPRARAGGRGKPTTFRLVGGSGGGPVGFG